MPDLLITPDHLRDLVPALCAATAETHAAALNPALAEFEIQTPRRIAAALAQFAHETGGFRTLREFGNDAYFARYDDRKPSAIASPATVCASKAGAISKSPDAPTTPPWPTR